MIFWWVLNTMKNNLVTYTEKFLLDYNGTEIMREWETPIMKKHVDILNINMDSVLEIGFGMGISADYIQTKKPTKHTIIEINDIIYLKAKKWSEKYKNIEIIHSSWQEVIDLLHRYDCIFFDTHNDNPFEFYKKVDGLLNIGGRFSYFDVENWFNNDSNYNVIRECDKVTEVKQDGTSIVHDYCVPLYIKNENSSFLF